MLTSSNQKSGFTIVELLIVIVVIGILAAISIVAYNGVQAKAANQQTISSVRAYYTALQAYAVDNDDYPSGNTCLGPEDFYVSNPCYIGTGTYTYSAAQNASLEKYLNSPQSLPKGKVVGSGITSSGIFYYPSSQYLGFSLRSTSACPSIAGARDNGKTIVGADVYCRISFPAL